MLIGVLLAMLLAACARSGPPPAAPPPHVGIVVVHAQPVPLTHNLVGRLSATRSADVRARVAGVLLKRLYTEGSDVKAGQPLFQIDPAVERGQVARLQALRASRSAGDWERALSKVSQTARDGGNLVPTIVDAVEAKATVGEIADTLRDVFGVYQEPATT